MKRFEEDRKPDEAAAATKGLQHKLRADWKQKRYQVRRANAATSLNDARLHTSEISFVRPVMGTKTEVPGRASEEKPNSKKLVNVVSNGLSKHCNLLIVIQSPERNPSTWSEKPER